MELFFLFADAKLLRAWTGRLVFVFGELILLGETTAAYSETYDYASYADKGPRLCPLNHKETVAYIFITLAYTRMFKAVLDTDSENLSINKSLLCWGNSE
jgi:hypothetical protein